VVTIINGRVWPGTRVIISLVLRESVLGMGPEAHKKGRVTMWDGCPGTFCSLPTWMVGRLQAK
jgi:hypothetical protein